MYALSERMMFLLVEKLREIKVLPHQRPKIKIVIVSNDSNWRSDCFNWIHDHFGLELKHFPTISLVAPKTRACSLSMDHPNCLVLLQGEDNSCAIKEFLERNHK
jgi:hypothetical protein